MSGPLGQSRGIFVRGVAPPVIMDLASLPIMLLASFRYGHCSVSFQYTGHYLDLCPVPLCYLDQAGLAP
jgi:hypothetical protein